MTGPLSDQQLDEATALLARLDAVPSMGHLNSADLGWVRPVLHDLLDEVRRLHGERGDLTEKLHAATKTAVRLADTRDYALTLLARFTDDEPCHLDHHGNCQAHGVSEAPCRNAEARLLLGLDTEAAGDGTAP